MLFAENDEFDLERLKDPYYKHARNVSLCENET